MTRFHIFLFPFLLGLVSITKADEKSPVLLWSPERSMVNFPDVSSVDSFSPSDFYDQYLSPLMHKGKENAIIFLQDKLSVDDFTKYADVYSVISDGGAFKNVKRLMEDHFSLEIPQVDSPHLAVEKLQKNFDGNVHVIDKLSQLRALELDSGKRFLVIVNLQPVIGAGDEEKTIRENDVLVGDVTGHLQERGVKYSAIFTGKSALSSDVEEISDVPQHSNRHLLASVEEKKDNCTFMNVTGPIFVYLCKVKVCVKMDTPDKCDIDLNVTVTEDVAKTSEMHNTSAKVVLKFDNVPDKDGNTYDLRVEMEVSLHQDRWVMDRNSLYLTQHASTKNKTEISNATLINYSLDKVIPRLYSFHCSSFKLFVDTVKEPEFAKYKEIRLVLQGFQFQVFDIANNRFFFAQDCVGFFTAGIWMGVFSGLLLVALLIYGTLMVLNLSVMDKFDDPKGKTITVSVSDS